MQFSSVDWIYKNLKWNQKKVKTAVADGLIHTSTLSEQTYFRYESIAWL